MNETRNELLDGNGVLLFGIRVASVTPTECDVTVGDFHNAMISDGDLVRVPAKIFEGLFRTCRGWFWINDPFCSAQFLDQLIPLFCIVQWGGIAFKSQLSLSSKSFEALDESCPEPDSAHDNAAAISDSRYAT